MFCNKCGSELKKDARFCSKCGKEIVIGSNIIVTGQKRFSLSSRSKKAILSVSCIAALCIVLFFAFRETPETRVVKALQKMQNQKRVDMVVDVHADIYTSDETIPLQQRMEIQSDATQEDNPLCSIKSTTYANQTTCVVNAYYKDGYSYAESEDYKIKAAVDFDEFQNEYTKIIEKLLINPKEDVPNADIHEKDNGEVYAKFDVNGKDFAKAISLVLNEAIGEFSINSDSYSTCSVTMVVGKDNTIHKMQFDYDFSVACYGTTVNVAYEALYRYNEVDEDFEIVFPEDLDTYDIKAGEVSPAFSVKDYSGKTILDASHVDKVSVCETNDTYNVKLTMTQSGKEIFAVYSTDNVKTTAYIYVHDSKIMAPTIYQPITDGIIAIPMSSYEEAESLFESLTQ